MQAAAEFIATKREHTGKGAARALRRQGKIPAIIYGKEKGNIDVALDENVVSREYYLGGLFSKVISVKTGDDSVLALPKDIQLHPVNDRIIHMDLLAVDASSTIKAIVPIRFLHTDRCIGIKRGGNLNIVRHDLELSCRVDNIPRQIEIDVSKLNIGDSLHISHVSLPEGVEPTITSRDFTIATVTGRGGKQDKADEADQESAEGAEGEGEAKKAE